MIARTWHGAVSLRKGDEYYDYLFKTGVTDCRKTKGNLGVQVFRRDEGEYAHFLFISFWDGVESIKDFAGEDYSEAVFYEADRRYLLDLEPVYHFDVLTK